MFIFKRIYIIGDIMLSIDLKLYLYCYKLQKKKNISAFYNLYKSSSKNQTFKNVFFTMNISPPAIDCFECSC